MPYDSCLILYCWVFKLLIEHFIIIKWSVMTSLFYRSSHTFIIIILAKTLKKGYVELKKGGH